MTDPFARHALLFVAGFVAGTINSVAGGGSLLTFPALLSVGLGPIAANATNTVALIPGSFAAFLGYRDTFAHDRRLLTAMALPSVVGGSLGALAAMRVSDQTFARLVPWLILLATTLFALQDPLRRALRARLPPTASDAPAPPRAHVTLALFQLAVAFYGGFFGAGIGILMLSALAMMGVRDVHRANGLKNLAAVCINGFAAVAFLLGGRVVWMPALVIMVGAAVGGWGGAGLARRAGQVAVRRVVTAVGVGLTAVMFARGL